MRILITGASGFIGRALTDELQGHGHEVRGTSTSGTDGLLPLDLELQDPGHIENVFREARPEAVVHLAAIQSVRGAAENPARAFRVNTAGTAVMLAAAEKLAPGAHFLFASTAAVYGGGKLSPGDSPGVGSARFLESDPVGPLSPYGASKAAAEYLAFAAGARTGMPVSIIRLFNQIGPGQPADQVPAGFANSIARAEGKGERRLAVEIGNPDAARDFTDVRDTAIALRLVCERCVTGTLNLCSGQTRTLSAVIDSLSSLTAIQLELRPVPERTNPNDVEVIGGSPEKLTTSTGWIPKLAFEESLADLLQIRRGEYPSA